jgi:vitamin B12 transporter
MSPYPNNRKAVLTILPCLLFSFAAHAEEDIDQEDQIIVTASRYEQPLSQVGSSISVLTQLDLETDQYTYVLDALQSVPGVTTNQNGAFGGTASVSIRGMGGDRTKLLLDGIELNDASSPGTAYNFGTLFNVAGVCTCA